jgi:hypothetical protein
MRVGEQLGGQVNGAGYGWRDAPSPRGIDAVKLAKVQGDERAGLIDGQLAQHVLVQRSLETVEQWPWLWLGHAHTIAHQHAEGVTEVAAHSRVRRPRQAKKPSRLYAPGCSLLDCT